MARAFRHGLGKFEAMRGRADNVGLSDASLSKLELCEEIRRHVPRFTVLQAPVGKHPDQRNYVVSNARIEATGYAPTVSLADGIRELVKAYQVVRRMAFANA